MFKVTLGAARSHKRFYLVANKIYFTGYISSVSKFDYQSMLSKFNYLSHFCGSIALQALTLI